MRIATFLTAAALTVLLCAAQVSAAVLLTDGFEGYNIGALDKNYAGPNAAPNGSGNPWFGPAPPNAQVVNVDSGVSPHSGDKMIRGAFVTGSDLDENWYNLAYRLNGGNPYAGGIWFDWWFYDALGSGGTNFRDYGAVGFYNTAPGNTDYPGTGSLNSSTQIQRLGLGAPYNSSAGYDPTKYQARVVGATDGYSGTTYFNTNTSRSVGWHHARVEIGVALGNNTNDVRFFIDDLVNPTLSHNSMTAWGYNVLEFDTKYGTQTGYFDDASFGTIPEPGSLLALATGLISLVGLARRRR